jgi:hypothetical protein
MSWLCYQLITVLETFEWWGFSLREFDSLMLCVLFLTKSRDRAGIVHLIN